MDKKRAVHSEHLAVWMEWNSLVADNVARAAGAATRSLQRGVFAGMRALGLAGYRWALPRISSLCYLGYRTMCPDKARHCGCIWCLHSGNVNVATIKKVKNARALFMCIALKSMSLISVHANAHRTPTIVDQYRLWQRPSSRFLGCLECPPTPSTRRWLMTVGSVWRVRYANTPQYVTGWNDHMRGSVALLLQAIVEILLHAVHSQFPTSSITTVRYLIKFWKVQISFAFCTQ